MVISGGFTFKTDTLMLLDHRERIDGENVTWNPVNSDLGEIDVPMTYSIYTAGESQELVEWGTISRMRMGYKATGYTTRWSEFTVNRRAKIQSLSGYKLYSIVISGLF